ncbi:tetratricopeptide repeat-containing sensor histidine kinase [Mucilaginibacter celer]|uniref:histidine kinase n=1 Tax=Mucilaginibacter celer TaxID=2305508 RepID=A0A494VVA6_9SPHI|nr:histidine kinase dimerization/phosphoacceptor domain -containing protein [Mucilaginibacter celer]AYL95373.1 hypothetical protein HYN43_008740 [Mucilaginibacter celer]
MKIFSAIIAFLIVHSCQGQDITHNISRHQVDSVKQHLAGNKADTVRINAMLTLASFNILKPGEYKADLDTADWYLSMAEKLNLGTALPQLQGKIYLVKASLFRESGNRAEGKAAAKKAILILKLTDDKKDLGLAYYELAQYYNFNNPIELPEKINLTELATSTFEQSGNVELKAFCLKLLADLYNYNDDSYKALKAINTSLKAYQSIGHKEIQGVYDQLGSIYYVKADFIQALKYELAAIQTALGVRDTTMQVCEINNNIGLIYTKLEDNEKAIVYFKSALVIAEKYNDNPSIALLIHNTVNSYIFLKRASNALEFIKSVPQKYIGSTGMSINYYIPRAYINIYTSLKEFNVAKVYADQLHDILRHNKFGVHDKSNIYTALIRYYIASKQYTRAQKYLNKNDTLLQSVKDPNTISRNYDLWVSLDTSRGYYRAAYNHLLSKNKLNDAVLNENKIRQLKQITAFYESEEKENAIQLLKAQNRLQQNRIVHGETIRKWAIALVALLIVLLAVGIDRYRVKRRINRLLEAQQVKIKSDNNTLVLEKNDLLIEKDDLLTQKEWLLSEIHHRVRNNLHTVVSLLESQAIFLKNDALKAIEKSQHRIYAMSLIHQKIYSDEHLKAVDISAFIPELARYLTDSYRTYYEILFKLAIDPVKVSVAQSIPLALIINEIITNAIVHAFHKKASGIISIRMHQTDNLVTLVIADNGVGIDPGKCSHPPDTLGMVLINGLSEDIHAEINIKNDHGTSITLVFPTEIVLEQKGDNYS